MIAVEFQAHVKDGTIEVPEQYRGRFEGEVRVIILHVERQKKSRIIDKLLEHPIADATFRPLTRDEIYDRQK
ncbi:hypothetical protein HC891_05830 [Candidatus Gracilibacteria bacterium]|nr:hypothetical protein [Candidatus Gracilibacteria bacterium]